MSLGTTRHGAVLAAIGASLAVMILLAGCGGGGSMANGSGENGSDSGGGVPGGVAPSSLPPAVAQAKSQNTAVDPTIVSADNTFGLSLLNTLIPANPEGNTAIAPISVAMTLQIVYNGAAGSTQQAMAGTLQLGGLT